MEKPVLLEIEDRIALITLNRPEIHNAINGELLRHLITSLMEVKSNDEIRVAILTGKGKSFCSGVDLKAVTSENIFDPFDDGTDLPDVIHTCKKPIIGAINGHAITGGFEIALNCDFLIASEKAFFQDTHARLGAHPGWGMTSCFSKQSVKGWQSRSVSHASPSRFSKPLIWDSSTRWSPMNDSSPGQRRSPHISVMWIR